MMHIRIMLVLLLIGVALSGCSPSGKKQPAWIQKGLKEWHDNAGEIVFFGRVIDQYGQSIEGVVIKVDAPIPVGYLMDEPRKQQVRTDKEGFFKVSKDSYGVKEFKGNLLSIDGIEKDGYEYIPSADSATSFMYGKNCVDRFTPDKTKPIVFHMRKKAENPVFLFEDRFLELQVQTDESRKMLGYDFIRRQRIKDMANPMFDNEPLVCDLQVKATFDTNSMSWAVVLFPGGTNGGIIATDQLLYEAPQEGYQPEYSFVPEDHKTPKTKYLYLRSREPPIYSRLEIEHVNANNEFFRLSGKSMTNPYGDRNLEPATDLPYEVTEQLTDEARAALQQGKYPPKPDLSKLVKEAKEKAEKEKEKH